jgi:ABC-type uncharacterized transport system substrate-binding protein
MKLDELTSPAKIPPQKLEKKRRKEIGKDIINMIMKANVNNVKHSNLFQLANKAAGKDINATPLELQRDANLRGTRINMIAKSPLDVVDLHSIKKQMEKILKGS